MKLHVFLILVAVVGAILFQNVQAQESSDEDAFIAYLKGVYRESENDLSSAYKYYLYALSQEPGNVRILLRLSKTAVEIGDLEGAREYCNALIAKGEYVAEAKAILAEVEYRSGDKEKALELLTALRDSVDISRAQVFKFIAKIDMELDRNDEARRVLEEASRFPDADFYIFYELGLLDADAHRTQEALDAMGKAIEIDPDFLNCHLVRARLFMEGGRTAEAKPEYREALRLEPLNREAILGLAGILHADGEFAEGAALLAPLHRDGSLDEGGEIVYGRFLYKAGQTDSALSVFGRLLDKRGDKPPLLRVVSEIEVDRGHFRSAYRYLKRLVELEPDRFENYIGLLLMLYHVAPGPATPEEAIEISEGERRALIDKAERLVGSESVENNFIIGSILRKAGETDEAERRLLKAEELDTENESVALELATLYGHSGRFDEALKRVVNLYKGNPEDASIANFYGYLLAEKGESLDFAEKLIGKALAKEPENGYFLDSLGWIKFKMGRYREALDIFLRAVDKVGDDAVIWEHVGDAYLKLNETAAARAAYQKSLAIDPRSVTVDGKARKLESDGKAN
ncbi:MAG: tetratricopeptide repeat protein [Candidatus Krumholzibacteria bacterium]|nr:tetratricopeptide repeat protein [Candidatus Krumholzibacteria bacterium]